MQHRNYHRRADYYRRMDGISDRFFRLILSKSEDTKIPRRKRIKLLNLVNRTKPGKEEYLNANWTWNRACEVLE